VSIEIHMIFRGSFWKTQSPMTSIQDSQREQESLFFDQITVSLVKSRKGEKGLPGTPDQPCSKFLSRKLSLYCLLTVYKIFYHFFFAYTKEIVIL